MKNPLEFTLLEVSVLMREAGPDAPEKDFTRLVHWIAERQKYLQDYKVQKQAEEIRAKKQEPSKRAARSLDADLMDEAPVEWVTLDQSA